MFKVSKFTIVNADSTTKEYNEQSDIIRHLVVKSVFKFQVQRTKIFVPTEIDIN